MLRHQPRRDSFAYVVVTSGLQAQLESRYLTYGLDLNLLLSQYLKTR